MADKERAGCILIRSDKRVLCVHNSESDYWGFPKGHLLPGESTDCAALRELKEETGIELDPQILTKPIRKNRTTFYIINCSTTPNCVVDGREIIGYEWLNMAELSNRKTSRLTKIFINYLSGTMY